MTRAFSVAATAVLVLSLSGCGVSAEDDRTAATALSDKLISTQETSSADTQLLTWKREEADCVGEGMVADIGTEKLQDYGLLDDDLKARKTITAVKMSAGDAKKATDVVFGCADVPEMVKGALAQNDDVPARVQACVAKVLTEKTLRPVFLETFQGNQAEATAALTDPVSTCALGSEGDDAGSGG